MRQRKAELHVWGARGSHATAHMGSCTHSMSSPVDKKWRRKGSFGIRSSTGERRLRSLNVRNDGKSVPLVLADCAAGRLSQQVMSVLRMSTAIRNGRFPSSLGMVPLFL